MIIRKAETSEYDIAKAFYDKLIDDMQGLKYHPKWQKAIRLDVLFGNLPAYRLYDSMGFKRVGDITLFYEDTGITDFTLYEYLLQPCTIYLNK